MMIMKKSMKSLFVIIAAMVTFAGCQKEENNAPAIQTKTVEFFAESIETKTHFGDKNAQNQYPVYWDADDKVKVLLNIEQVAGTEKTVTVTPSDDFTSARFVADITDPATAETPVESYTFYSVSPSSAYNVKSSTDGRITVTIPAAQTPLATSVDKAAQVLYAVSETTATMQSSINLAYHHLTAYGKFSLANLTSDVSSVSKIRIVAPEGVYISGKWNYLVEGGNIAVHKEGMTNDITLTTTKTTDIWFSCGPLDVSGKTFKFIVTTDKGDLEKEITFPSGCIFESGKIATFTVNMAGIEPPVQEETSKYYQKVTAAPSDWSGKYLIVYESGTNAYVFNGQDAVNGYVSATISEGKITSTDALAAVQVTIESMTGGYAVKTANGYISGTSGSNVLNFNASDQQLNTISLESSDEVLLTSNTSVLRFNNASNQMRFRYYKRSSYSDQKAICLYRLVDGESGGEEEPDTPAAPVQLTMSDITCSAKTANTLTFSWTSVPNATKYEVIFDNGSAEEVTTTTYEATGLEAETEYTISVKAVGDGTNYTTSEAKTQTGTTTAAQGGGGESAEPVTVAKVVKDYADKNGWSNSVKYSTLVLDDVITATATGTSNTGKYYTSGYEWRIYQTENPTLKITAVEGYTIQTVKITYNVSNNGTLKLNSSNVSSGSVVSVNAGYISFGVGNTSTKTNGQVKVTAIEVVYQPSN